MKEIECKHLKSGKILAQSVADNFQHPDIKLEIKFISRKHSSVVYTFKGLLPGDIEFSTGFEVTLAHLNKEVLDGEIEHVLNVYEQLKLNLIK